MAPKKSYTVKEASEVLDRCYHTVLKYIHKKWLKASQIGGEWKITAEELERFQREGNLPSDPKEEEND